jgi:hypothetical protein
MWALFLGFIGPGWDYFLSNYSTAIDAEITEFSANLAVNKFNISYLSLFDI